MFIVIKKSKIIIGLVLLIVIAIVTVLIFSTNITNAFSVQRKLPIYNVDTVEKKVALSFDAAWGADKTSKIMDILDEYNVKATFFLVGFWINKFPEKTQEIHDRGFLIGNHSTNHLHMSKLSSDDIAKEIQTTNKKLKEITKVDTVYFRAPFGEYNNKLIEYIESAKMQCIQWDVDSLDWKGLTGSQIADRILSRAKEGSIILCHNNSDYILEALPLVLMGLKNKGLTSVNMNELVISENYYINNSGKQYKK